MRHLTAAGVCLGILVACSGVPPPNAVRPESRRLEAEFDQACDAAVRILTERGYDIRRIDRAQGIIETGWKIINAKYAANIFLTQHRDRYSECGKPGVGWAFQGKQARLDLALLPIRRGETDLRIEAFFRTQRYSGVPLLTDGPGEDVPCYSRGRLEEEVRVEIQLRTFSDQLDRHRRGVP